MYEIELKEYKDYYNNYYYTAKNEAGQILNIEFNGWSSNKSIVYYVKFYIGKRKQGYDFLNTTGKDGLKSLIWAKNCIKHFIDNVQLPLKYNYFTSQTIAIFWDDSQRRDVYTWGLKSLGFLIDVIENKKCLMYKFKTNK